MKAPGQNICKVDNRNYTGWPYDGDAAAGRNFWRCWNRTETLRG